MLKDDLLEKNSQFVNENKSNDFVFSDFVLDLRHYQKKEDASAVDEGENKTEEFWERISVFSFKRYFSVFFKKVISKTGIFFRRIRKSVSPIFYVSGFIFLLMDHIGRIIIFFQANFLKFEAIFSSKLRRHKKKNVIFRPLILVFSFLYKIFYITTWSLLFVIRFFYFFILSVSSFIVGHEKRKDLAVKLNSIIVEKHKENEEEVIGPVLLYIDEDIKADKNEFSINIKDKIVPQFLLNFFKNINHSQSALVFPAILLAIIIPLKAFTYSQETNIFNLKERVLGVSESAKQEFLDGAESATSLNFSGASDNFIKAGKNFMLVKKDLSGINDLLLSIATVIPNKDIKLASESKKIVDAGITVSNLGVNISSAIDVLLNKDENRKFNDRVEEFLPLIKKASLEARVLEKEINKIKIDNLPEEYREKFYLARDKSSLLPNILDDIYNLAESAKIFLGGQQDKRYLLVFQNNSELRASGGFIGSYALIDFRDGKIKNIEVPGGGSYDTEAGLLKKIVAPEPLHLVNPLWHFWDANWWPDWPTTARKLMWFYEKSDGPTVDGVISLTPTVLEDFLKITGPIDMTTDYGVVVDADNFWETVQTFAEQKPDVTKKPKKIIGDLMDRIIKEELTKIDEDKIFDIIKILEENLSEKQILIYFVDKEIEKEIDKYDWSGRVKNAPRDYLMVVNTNIAGGKSDKRIRETIEHEAQVVAGGGIINTVKITREHTGVKFEPFSGVRNVDWMRVYVPLGSELIEVSGFERPDEIYFEDPLPEWEIDPDVFRSESGIKTDEVSGTQTYNELGHTVFANWTMVDPGHTAVIYIKYKLPFKLEKKNLSTWEKIKSIFLKEGDALYTYSLLVQKQPGAMPSLFKSSIKLIDGLDVLWLYSPDGKNENDWLVESSLDRDKYWATILKNN